MEQHELSSRSETELLDMVDRLDRMRDGRRAVHIHLSGLQPHNRRDHHLRIAANSFEGLIKSFRGNLYRMHNEDLVFVCEGATVAQIDDVILKLRFLFSDDPLASDAGVSDDEEHDHEPAHFCTWYDLKRDYPQFREMADSLLAEVNSKIENREKRLRSAAPGAPAQIEKKPIDAGQLARLESALINLDLRPFLRRQPICAVVGSMPPEPVFNEYFISMMDLGNALLPDCNITADPWLFQHFTAKLDMRVLDLIAEMGRQVESTAVSLNVNLSTLLSEEFLQFDTKFQAVTKRHAVFEIQPFDIFADMGGYIFARDFMHEKGYRLLLDGLKHHTLPLIPRDQLKIDLLKITWSPDLISDAHSARRKAFEKAIKKTNPQRVILCRCDDQRAIDFGHSLGISLFQGRYVDRRLQDKQKAADEEMRKRRQANSLAAAEAEAEAEEMRQARRDQLAQ